MNLHLMSVEADTVFLRVEGPITPGASAIVHDPMEKLIDPQGYSRTVLLDLAKADYIDSSGIAWLLKWDRRTRQAGGVLGLCSLSPQVSEVLRISRIDQVLKIWPDERAARAALASRGKS